MSDACLECGENPRVPGKCATRCLRCVRGFMVRVRYE